MEIALVAAVAIRILDYLLLMPGRRDDRDDHRANTDPYNKAHPGKPPRTYWSNWNKPGEQEHWCRGGENYPVTYCPHFVKYKGQQVKTCLKANVSVFQDGYIDCNLVESFGCEACYREFEERIERS